MYKIGQGIQVHFDNDRSKPNIVFFPDGSSRGYAAGEMLLELLSDSSLYLMTEKPLNMIKAFPGYGDEISRESIVEGFKWVHETVENDELPVTTWLLRSQFNRIVLDLAAESGADYPSVGSFLEACAAKSNELVDVFLFYSRAIVESNSANPGEESLDAVAELASEVKLASDSLYRKCSVRKQTGGVRVEVFEITDVVILLLFEFGRMEKENRVIKACANCGRLFIPQSRNDAIYCLNPAPGKSGKTCRDVGPHEKRAVIRANDEEEHHYHNEKSRLRMLLSRLNPETDQALISSHRKTLEDTLDQYDTYRKHKQSE